MGCQGGLSGVWGARLGDILVRFRVLGWGCPGGVWGVGLERVGGGPSGVWDAGLSESQRCLRCRVGGVPARLGVLG